MIKIDGMHSSLSLNLIFSNCGFDKFLIFKIPILGNQFNECNTYGILLKSLLHQPKR